MALHVSLSDRANITTFRSFFSKYVVITSVADPTVQNQVMKKLSKISKLLLGHIRMQICVM